MMAKADPEQKAVVARVMDEFKHGDLKGGGGQKVRNPKQAIAIALSEAGESNRQTPAQNRARLAHTKAAGGGATRADLYAEATRRGDQGTLANDQGRAGRGGDVVKRIAAALFGVCLFGGLAWAATPDEIVANRQNVMKQMSHIGKDFKGADGTDTAKLSPEADKLADLGHDIAAMFPVGTEEAHETEALPYVWSNRADFEARSAQFAADTAKLAQLGHGKDPAALTAQWAVVQNECGACHRNFKHH